MQMFWNRLASGGGTRRAAGGAAAALYRGIIDAGDGRTHTLTLQIDRDLDKR
jgi:hypothetical protein